MHAPVEDKNDDTNDKFYEEVEYVFSQLYMHHIKIFFWRFQYRSGKGHYFLTDRYKRLDESINNNVV